jgi:D-beta-D-heptose 7-phosphate kinase / D-beta-D-heptose 1-phosphate adenosyltransferase
MNSQLFDVINTFFQLKVLIIGDAMLDTYIKGETERLCREAPVPVVIVQEREDVPGGAANTAVNTHTLGGQVFFLSVIGDDVEGKTLIKSLEEQGVSPKNILVRPDRQTLAKQRVIAASQMMVRYDQGSTGPIDPEIEEALIARIKTLFPKVDAVILSDYDYGILTPRVIQVLEELQADDPHIIVADSKRLEKYRGLNLTAVKPNYSEALNLLKMEDINKPHERISQIIANGEAILDHTGAHIAAVTIDQDGALIFERGREHYRTYAQPNPQSRAAGAGDTFVCAFTLALAAGAATPAAAEIASVASSIVVEKLGTSTCTWEELKSCLYGDDKVINDVFYLAARVSTYRREGKKIVFTNGCFDILHRGHITYLNQAKSLGDILVVGVNSDNSVRRLKGHDRPINSLEDRSLVLAALSCVDHIIPFDSDTPKDLIRSVKPDVFVKGGDYTRENLPEASLVESLGGRVEILPYIQDQSTTGTIERIQKLMEEKTVQPKTKEVSKRYEKS